MSDDAYDELRYEGCCVPITAPALMSAVASFAGFATPELDAVRVLEIGCGDGGNLLPLAHYHPAWTFVGIDPSGEAIRVAQAGQAALRLSNTVFVQSDAAGANLEGKFDFVICHGVYSWVSPEQRDTILALATASLSPLGLFYLSYNTEPGWRARGLVRERLRKRSQSGSLLERAEAAREELELMSLLLGSGDAHPYISLLRREIGFAKEKPLFHLAHEYLAEHNRAFWFGEVWDAAASHGLKYVGDSQDYRAEGFVSPEQRGLARERSRDRREREETLDLACYRQMRASLFAKAERGHSEVDSVEVLRDSTLHSCLRPLEIPVDLSEATPAVFQCPYTERQMQAASMFGKAALLSLAQVYPRGLSVPEIVAQVESVLCAGRLAESGAELSEFLQGFAHLHELALVEVRAASTQEDEAFGASSTPRLHALARYEVECRPFLTSPLHSAIPMDAIDRVVLGHMDGAHDLDLLIAIAEEEGCEDAETRVSRLQQTLLQWGLLS